MKQYQVLITEPAADDLQALTQYIIEELLDPDTAKKLVGKIKEAVLSFGEMPNGHALLMDSGLAAQGIRKFVVDNYIVFYVVSEKEETVTVLRILYVRRDWEHML